MQIILTQIILGGVNMDMSNIVAVISSVGFPIVACIGLGWYVKYQTDNNNKEVAEMRREHADEISKVTDALNNNTIALQRLCDKIDANVKEV